MGSQVKIGNTPKDKKKAPVKKQTPFMKDVMDELNLLGIIVKSFEKFDEEARFRNMKYLVDRFNKYVPSPSL